MKQITEDYVSFEIAKLLKEKGFSSEDCLALYNEKGDIGFLQTFGDMSEYLCDNSYIDAPTLQMAMKWLRENHSIFIATEFGWFHGNYDYQASVVKMNPTIPPTLDSIEYIKSFRNNTLEKSCDEAIKYCLINLI